MTDDGRELTWASVLGAVAILVSRGHPDGAYWLLRMALEGSDGRP